jgi:hypothetical protein
MHDVMLNQTHGKPYLCSFTFTIGQNLNLCPELEGSYGNASLFRRRPFQISAGTPNIPTEEFGDFLQSFQTNVTFCDDRIISHIFHFTPIDSFDFVCSEIRRCLTYHSKNKSDQRPLQPLLQPRLFTSNISTCSLFERRDSAVGIATGYGMDDQGVGVGVPVGPRIFHFSTSFRPPLGPTQPTIQWVPGALYPRGKAARP